MATNVEGDVRMLQVTVTDASSGQPLAGAKVHLTIEGSGSFDAFQPRTKDEATSNEFGNILSQWFEYPRYRPRRELKSIVQASCAVPNSQVRLVDLHEQGGPRFQTL